MCCLLSRGKLLSRHGVRREVPLVDRCGRMDRLRVLPTGPIHVEVPGEQARMESSLVRNFHVHHREAEMAH